MLAVDTRVVVAAFARWHLRAYEVLGAPIELVL